MKDKITSCWRELGVIRQAGRGRFRRVCWYESGIPPLVQRVDSGPPEFFKLPKGQYFEAKVLRDSETWAVLGMTDFKLNDPPKHMTEEESLALWNSIQTTASLPEVSWDEIDGIDEEFWLTPNNEESTTSQEGKEDAPECSQD